MTYFADYQFFTALYGGKKIAEQTFNRLAWGAQNAIRYFTIGVDGVDKLEIAYPDNENAVEALKRCLCALVDFANEVELAQQALSFQQNADGTVSSKMITSRSSGAESISYAAAANATVKSAAAAVAGSESKRRAAQYEIVKEYLSGIADANGVNLLYMGAYPYV